MSEGDGQSHALSVAASNEDLRAVEPADTGLPQPELALFRSEALTYANRRLQGEVVLAVPLRFGVYAFLLIAILVAAAAFAVTGTYTRKETVIGWVQPEAGIIRAAATQGGLIQKISISEGMAVSAGAPLAELKLTPDLMTGQVGDLILESLKQEQSALQAQAEATSQTLRIQREALLEEQKALAAQLVEAERRSNIAVERQKLTEIDYDRTEKLVAEGAFPTSRVETAKATLLSAESTVSQAQSAVLTLREHLHDIEVELAKIPAEQASHDARLAQSRAQLWQKLINANAQTTYLVTAPISGNVLAVPVEEGQALPQGGTIAVIAPKGSQLVADLYAPSRAAGFIKEGQAVRVMYQAFPHEKYGAGNGKIVRVSNTVLGPQEVGITGMELQEPVFRVRVVLEKQFVEAYGESIPLQPGMLLSADIVIDRRSLLEWVLDPLIATGKRL